MKFYVTLYGENTDGALPLQLTRLTYITEHFYTTFTYFSFLTSGMKNGYPLISTVTFVTAVMFTRITPDTRQRLTSIGTF